MTVTTDSLIVATDNLPPTVQFIQLELACNEEMGVAFVLEKVSVKLQPCKCGVNENQFSK